MCEKFRCRISGLARTFEKAISINLLIIVKIKKAIAIKLIAMAFFMI